MSPRHLRIGTRGSPMALRQTALVRDCLVAAHPELGATGAVVFSLASGTDGVPGNGTGRAIGSSRSGRKRRRTPPAVVRLRTSPSNVPAPCIRSSCG